MHDVVDPELAAEQRQIISTITPEQYQPARERFRDRLALRPELDAALAGVAASAAEDAEGALPAALAACAELRHATAAGAPAAWAAGRRG